MEKMPDCKNCQWLVWDRIKKQRKRYWCSNPRSAKIPDEEFGKRPPMFIAWGASTPKSPLERKACPQWCPLR